MTEAPERIWACMSGPMVGLFVSGGNNGGWPEYVRADAARAELEALDPDAIAKIRADALREAATKATSFLVGDPKNDIPLRNPMAHEIAAAIRALIQKEKDDAE